MSHLSHETIGSSVINKNTQGILSVWVNHHVCYFLFSYTLCYAPSLRQIQMHTYIYAINICNHYLTVSYDKHNFAALKKKKNVFQQLMQR